MNTITNKNDDSIINLNLSLSKIPILLDYNLILDALELIWKQKNQVMNRYFVTYVTKKT